MKEPAWSRGILREPYLLGCSVLLILGWFLREDLKEDGRDIFID